MGITQPNHLPHILDPEFDFRAWLSLQGNPLGGLKRCTDGFMHDGQILFLT